MLNQLTNIVIKTNSNHTDKDLIKRWKDGDESAFELLYHKYAVELLSIAMQKTNDREISKDLVQTVFITFFNNKNSAHEISSLMAYLYTILKNRILDHYRHDLVQKKYHTDFITQPQAKIARNDVHAYIDTKELELRLIDEVKKLPPQCENVFRLRREQELSNREIAQHLNISENTVEQHMRKALRLLKLALNVGQRTFLVLIFILIMGK